MKEYLSQLGIEYILLIGAVAGAIVALKKSKEKWYQTVITFFVGIISAIYLSPLVCSILSISEDKYRMGIAFLIGYGGIGFVDKLSTVINKKLDNGDTK